MAGHSEENPSGAIPRPTMTEAGFGGDFLYGVIVSINRQCDSSKVIRISTNGWVSPGVG